MSTTPRRMWPALLVCLMAPAWAAAGAGAPPSEPGFAVASRAPAPDSIRIAAPLPAHAPRWLAPVSRSSAGERGARRAPARPAPTGDRGINLVASSLQLTNDYAAVDGFFLRAAVTNAGANDAAEVRVRFFLGDPDAGGTQLGADRLLPAVAAGTTVRDSIPWAGVAGAFDLHLVVDPLNAIAETNETDNRDRLGGRLVRGVPWAWQEVNGYCHYAAQTMLFNLHGADNTVRETVELSNCPHSAVYLDGDLQLYSGIFVSQGYSDMTFAGGIRNLFMDLDVRTYWSTYLSDLRGRIDAGRPFETSVDPYYLPQPDWDPLRLYNLHSGHAVVVTGYTDSSIVVQDPGVGIVMFDEPALPQPELRGTDVVVSLAGFRHAVESTIGTRYLLITYIPTGPMPDRGTMLLQSIPKSLQRLDGEAAAYDSGWRTFPPGYLPVYGSSAYASLRDDLTPAAFAARYAESIDAQGGDWVAALSSLAAGFADPLWFCGIAWEASREHYATIADPRAAAVAALSDDLTLTAGQASLDAYAMLEAVYAAGGAAAAADPYLSGLAAQLDAITVLEGQVREALADFYSVADAGAPGDGDAPAAAMAGDLMRCAPNPFGRAVELRLYNSPRVAQRVEICDLLGRVVRRLDLARTPEGALAVWDARDRGGRLVPPGVYFAHTGYGPAARIVRVED
jgi:hypothetical protein